MWGIVWRRIGGAALVASSLAFACPAAATATTGTGTAAIVTPLTVVNAAPLSFGSVVPGAASGTVTIDAFTEARTVAGGVSAAGGTVSAAKFSGLTTSLSHLKIDIPNGAITLTRVGGGATMTVDSFALNGNKNDWVASTTVFSFQVGAVLHVGANQLAGTYNGTFNVTVNYR